VDGQWFAIHNTGIRSSKILKVRCLTIPLSSLATIEKWKQKNLIFRQQSDILLLQYFCISRYTYEGEQWNSQFKCGNVVTLPAELREKYKIENGKIFHLVDLDGIFVFVPMVPMVPELANEIERIRLEAGLSVDELLDDLRKQRERYNKEKYGEQPA
jgi:bifunctional DNA-binding transcriptional regulator/antitoxin component of YhaV-PrlF toxin-antitoxin module